MRNIILAAIAALTLEPMPSLATKITIQPGETLSEISTREGISIQSLIRINRITNPNNLQAGQLLLLSDNQTFTTNQQDHLVRKGETLSIIALQYEINQKDIIKLNNITNEDYLYEGQVIKLPAYQKEEPLSSAHSNLHRVSKGETLNSIAMKYNINKDNLASINDIMNTNYIYPGQHLKLREETHKKKLQVPATGKPLNSKTHYHKIKRGETLLAISKANQIALKDLIKINKINDPNKIKPGTTLSLKLNHQQVQKGGNLSNEPNEKVISPKGTTAKLKSSDWRSYGPLKINWSNWQSMGGSYVTSSLNKDGKALYLAVNCTEKKLNATGANGVWKTWISAIDTYEHKLINDLCKSKKVEHLSSIIKGPWAFYKITTTFS